MIGRTTECAELRTVLAAARAGASETRVIRGEAGIGKTALLEYAAGQARDFRVLRVTGIEGERELGFAGLYQLVKELLPDLPGLPGPQRAALESAFGLVSGPPPDRFLVALATLTLLSAAADRTPAGTGLLIVADDAQWLDQASAGALVFAARRLQADRVAVLFAVRENAGNQEHFDGLPSLRVRALAGDDARELVQVLAAGTVAPAVAGQIAERTGGVPLAIVETARELTGEQLSGAALLPDPLPLGADARDVYWRRLAGLTPGQREFLLLASAEPSGDPGLLEKAAAYLDLDPELFRDPALRETVTVGDQVTFRHPLIRSAVYTGSPLRDRRRAHAALAAVTDPDRDPDRIAWHRAEAATGPDEEAAVLLEHAARRARQRGGQAASAAFWHRAAELTPDGERRCERLLASARAEYTAGRAGLATELLDQAEPGLRDARRQAQALQLRGEIQTTVGDGHHAPGTLLRAARAWAPLDPEASRNALLDAMLAEVYAGGHEWTGVYVGIRRDFPDGRTARSAIPDMILDGFSELLTEGPARGSLLLRRAVRALTEDGPSDGQLARWYIGGIFGAADLLDLDAVRQVIGQYAALCRARGDLTRLPVALDYLGMAYLWSGRINEAEAADVEGREILAATGTPYRLRTTGLEALVPAWRGQEERVRVASAAMREDAVAHGQRLAGLYVDFAAVILGVGMGAYTSVLAAARRLFAGGAPAVEALCLPYIAEVAAYCEDWETAERAVNRLAPRAEASGADWALGLLARCRALMVRSSGQDGDAEREASFAEAIRHLERASAISDVARTRLLYGEHLRRRKRRGPAREQLRAAWESFTAIGAGAFAERARSELVATGDKEFPAAARPDTTDSGHPALTEREAQIARLVVGGATNADVAAQLFISASTVDYHLRNTYRKAGVSSRTRLASVLRDWL